MVKREKIRKNSGDKRDELEEVGKKVREKREWRNNYGGKERTSKKKRKERERRKN